MLSHQDQLLASATRWEKLAVEAEAAAAWDASQGLGDQSVKHNKAATYRRTAESLRLEAQTGKNHCTSDELDVEPRPCVGCGYCCRQARCILGALVHGPGTDCPSLVKVEGRWRCRHVHEAEGEHLKFLYLQLHIGAGCCSPLNTDRRPYLSSSCWRLPSG